MSLSLSLCLYIYYIYISHIITIGLALEGHQHHCRLLKEAPSPGPGSTGSAGRDASIKGHHPLGALVETRLVTWGSWMLGEWYVWWLWDGSWNENIFLETTYFFWTCKMSWYWEILNGEWQRPSGSWHAPIRHSGDRNGVAGVSSTRTGKIWQKGLWALYLHNTISIYLSIHPSIYLSIYLQ